MVDEPWAEGTETPKAVAGEGPGGFQEQQGVRGTGRA